MGLPVVTIVGRPNVGKSSLLNCLAGRRISIVDATPGVTRDRVSTTIAVGEGETARYVELVDTGGMGVEDTDHLTDHVENQIAYAIHQATLVLFVVDAREGIVPLDNLVAEKLRHVDAPVLLVANKVDQAGVLAETGEFYALGFGDPAEISAAHNEGMTDLLERMQAMLTEAPLHTRRPEALKLAIVGKRNAGKSTLINALAGEDRVIVSETPGTTRDSVDVTVDIEGRRVTLIDTAGLRRNKSLANDVEFYSQHRAMRSVRRADVVAMVIDASVRVSKVDKNLAGIIAEEFKPVVIVVNKWDLARNIASPEDYAEYFAKEFPELSYAPISMTTAREGVNVHQTVQLATQLYAQASYRVQTSELNEAMEQILAKRGPSHKGGTRPPKLYYASQVATNPPTIVCFVNDVRSFDQSYQRFLVNQFREYLPYPEVPIRLILRPRRRAT
ncbi:MAG: ribosome biogenesis GTPase Der [Planctomycetes bacterium]|jgi:GTP-binding protein|nr:ribosome biogenesis GTPase Der [Planctomycetota bacterium]